MIADAVALTTAGAWMRVICGWLVLASFVFLASLIIISLLRAARFLNGVSKEIRLTRLELGKLAEEVHLLRQESKGDTDENSGEKSG